MTEVSTATTPAEGGCPVSYPSLESVACPYPIFTDQLEHGLMEPDGEGRPYLVSRHDTISHVLRHPEVFSSTTDLNAEAQPGWEASVFSSDPPEHTVKREIAHRVLKPGRLKTYEPMIEELIDDLIDDFIDDGEVDFVKQFANLMSSDVMFRLLDISREEGGWVADITFEGIGARFLPHNMQLQQEADGARLHEFMLDVVRRRVDNLGDDAISELIIGHRERKGEDDIDYLAVEASVFLLGGVLTTAHLTGTAMRLLLSHPDQMAAIRADYGLIPNMLEEAMRFESPLQFMPRVTLEDTELEGVSIPAKSELILVYAAGNRDENRFPEADRFDIRRDNVRRHLGFGLGAHFCLGAPLARLEGKIAYERLLTRLDNIRLADPSDEGGYIESAFNRGPANLHLKFDRAAQ
jgi:cytochrome P450